MSVPIRRPDFTSTYPTPESFKQAMELFDEVAMKKVPFVELPKAGPQEGQNEVRKARHLNVAPVPGDGDAPYDFRSTRGISKVALAKNNARIVSEHEGLVKTLLLSVPKVKESENKPFKIDPRHLGHFKSLMCHFGNNIDYIIVASTDQRPELEDIMNATCVSPDRVTFVLSPHFTVSIWVQDAHVAMTDCKGRSILLEGVVFNRFEDMSVADDVAAQVPTVGAMQSDLFFQGGNVLGGSDVTLIGRDYLFRNSKRHGMPCEEDVLKEFARQLGTNILGLGEKLPDNTKKGDIKKLFDRGVFSGYGTQPIFHIDMYVTRTGVIDEKSKKEIVFLGRPCKAFQLTKSHSDVPEFDDDFYDSFFAKTAEQLESLFTVRELPLWLTFGSLRDINKRQKFYNLTWNNAIVENDGVTKRVLLPNYVHKEDARIYGVDLGLRKDLQNFVEYEWKSLGFEVCFTDSLEDLAWGDGAVHCMTKVLSRTPMKTT